MCRAVTYEEVPLGGCFTIHLEGTGLGDWIEAVTWHNGRQEIPRQLNDDLAARRLLFEQLVAGDELLHGDFATAVGLSVETWK